MTFFKHTFVLVSLLISTTCCLNAQGNNLWQIFHLDELNFKENNEFLNTPTIASTVEIVRKNSILKTAIYDRVIFVVEGHNFVIIEGQKVTLKSSDVLFVKANDIVEFLGEFQLLSWVSKSTKTKHDFKTQIFTEDTLTNARNPRENVWNRFVESTTMTTGLYMLPQILGGDDTLNHKFDEINLVLHGTAKFKMNDTIINVKPGSIMFVKNGVGHYFYDLSEDFDVYILFENH